MSNQEAPISFTTKINGDLLTFRANTTAEFIALADQAVSDPAFAMTIGLLQGLGTPNVANAAATLGGTVVAHEPVNQWDAPAPQTYTPPAPEPSNPWAAPQQAAPLCDHGQPMKLVPAGVSKRTGKPFKAFYCCANPDQAQQCKKTVAV